MAVNKTFETVGPSKLTVTVTDGAVSIEAVPIWNAGKVDAPNESNEFPDDCANLKKPQKKLVPEKWVLSCRPIRHFSWLTPKSHLIDLVKEADAKEVEAIREIRRLRSLLNDNGIEY